MGIRTEYRQSLRYNQQSYVPSAVREFSPLTFDVGDRFNDYHYIGGYISRSASVIECVGSCFQGTTSGGIDYTATLPFGPPDWSVKPLFLFSGDIGLMLVDDTLPQRPVEYLGVGSAARVGFGFVILKSLVLAGYFGGEMATISGEKVGSQTFDVSFVQSGWLTGLQVHVVSPLGLVL